MFGTLNRELTSRDESLRGSEAEAAVCLYVAGTRHCNPASPAQPSHTQCVNPPQTRQLPIKQVDFFYLLGHTGAADVRRSDIGKEIRGIDQFRLPRPVTHEPRLGSGFQLAEPIANPLRTHRDGTTSSNGQHTPRFVVESCHVPDRLFDCVPSQSSLGGPPALWYRRLLSSPERFLQCHQQLGRPFFCLTRKGWSGLLDFDHLTYLPRRFKDTLD